MRIGLAVIRALGNAHWRDALAHHYARHVFDVLEEPLEPALKTEAIPQHEIGFLRLHNVQRGRLIVVDLGARLGDGLHHCFVPGDVLGDVLDDGEGRDDPEPIVSRGSLI